MTTQPEQPVIETPPTAVTPRKNSKLEQLHALYPEAKAKAEAAAAELKAITDGLKVELTKAAPEGADRIELTGEHGPTLRLTYIKSWRVDAKKLKAEDPETYVRYAVQGGTWQLKAARGGAE